MTRIDKHVNKVNGMEKSRQRWEKLWKELGPQTVYDPNHFLFIKNINDLFRSHFSEKRILEVGVGRGADVIALSKLGAECVAIDYTHSSIQLVSCCSKKKEQIYLAIADARKLPFRNGIFDLVFSRGLLEHFRDPSNVIREQIRCLKPGGYLVVDVPQKLHPYQLLVKMKILMKKWFAGWETSYSVSDIKKIAKIYGLSLVKIYHRSPSKFRANFILGRLSPYTAQNLGGIYKIYTSPQKPSLAK